MSQIQVGDAAPDFRLAMQDGREVALADYRGKQIVVLFFYPRNGTPACTAEACSFRDAYEDFAEAGAAVLGVSSASPQSHSGFALKHHLPFPLLADQRGSLSKAFGVPKTLGIFPGRVTYVIDKSGIVRHVFNSQWNAGRHVHEALRIVRELL